MSPVPSRPRLALGGGERPVELPEVGLLGSGLHPLSTAECVDFVLDELDRGRGGWLTGVHLDLLLACRRDPATRTRFEAADLRVPAGRLLVWACRLQRTPLPDCVELAGLFEAVAEEAARTRRAVFLVADSEAVAERAARALRERHPGLRLVGAAAAPPNVQGHPIQLARLSRLIDESEPDFVLLGLEAQREEELVRFLRHDRPEAWFLGGQEALRLLAGELAPTSPFLRGLGLDWVQRLLQEPRRLFGPYVLRGLPLGAGLLLRCAVRGTLPKGKDAGRYGRRGPRALLVDDDRFSLDHLELLLTSRFPDLKVEARTQPDPAGSYDFYFLDNEFEGEHLAAPMARRIREEHATATVIAFSGVLDVGTLKHLINAGCDGVCDKADPASWRPILELMQGRLDRMVERHKVGRSAFGGVRQSAYSLLRLLREWNEGAAARPRPAVEAAPREGGAQA